MTLLESLQCLLEGKKGDWIIENRASLLEPLYNKLESDHSFDMNVVEEKAQKLLRSKEAGELTPEDTKKEILKIALDEIEKKYPFIRKNLVWVLKEYTEDKFLFEDFPRVEAQLNVFERAKNKHKLEDNNLQNYDYRKLKDTVDNISDEELKSDHQRRKEGREQVQKAIEDAGKEDAKEDHTPTDFEIVWKTPELIVFHPFTYEAECKVVPSTNKNGKSCGWCTRAAPDCSRWGDKGQGYWNNYAPQGPIMPMHDLKKNDWFQVHFESNQFKDWDDDEVSGEDEVKFMNQRPYIKEFMVDYVSKHPMVVKKHRRWLPYLDKSKVDPELADWLAFEGSNAEFVQLMKSQGKDLSDKTKEQIIEADPLLITAIKSPSIELQRLALSKNPRAVRRTAPEEIRKIAFELCPTNLYDFASGKVLVNGEVKELTGNDLLSDEDVKIILSKKPLLISTILNDNQNRFSRFATEEYIKYAIEQDAKEEYPERVDMLIGTKISPELKAWADQVYDNAKAERESKKNK